MPKALLPSRPEASPRSRAMQASKAAEHKFFLLFIFLLAYLVFYPYVQNSGAGYYAFRTFALAITLLSVYAISFRRSLLFIGLVLAVPAGVAHLHMYRSDASAFSLLTIALSIAFDAFIIVVIFRRVFIHGNPNSETISGALCIYLLVGFGFASIYRLLNTLQQHAFYLDPHTNLHANPNRFDLIYYSFGTMTSLGAPGVTAVSDAARSVTAIEAILGVLYLAVMISRLVGAYRATSRDEYQAAKEV